MKKKTIAEPSFFGNIGPHDYCNLKLEKHMMAIGRICVLF